MIDGTWYWLDEADNMWRTPDEEYAAGFWWRVVDGTVFRQESQGKWVRVDRSEAAVSAEEAIVPVLKLVHLDERASVSSATAAGIRFDGNGRPVPADDESVVANWHGVAMLYDVMDDAADGSGRDFGVELVAIAEGELNVLVTERRLFGAFERAVSPLGDTESCRGRVLAFTWDLADVHCVSYELDPQDPGRERASEMTIHCVDPPAGLQWTSAISLDESWRPGLVVPNDLVGLARSVVEAAAGFRVARGEANERLHRAVDGEWEIDGNDRVMWMVNPAFRSSAAPRAEEG